VLLHAFHAMLLHVIAFDYLNCSPFLEALKALVSKCAIYLRACQCRDLAIVKLTATNASCSSKRCTGCCAVSATWARGRTRRCGLNHFRSQDSRSSFVYFNDCS